MVVYVLTMFRYHYYAEEQILVIYNFTILAKMYRNRYYFPFQILKSQ